ncbi:hypothetical protein PsorP6_003913 [Peronosclerospora sorghi]|uniref:Uncharacterized protein n=1 Tax=Peronosclerospora sorghi TaxID=230839 RepID=A0ACC0VJZ1_9STRA|nr:hypothetical protein PsorP6_003913 [Peronosclerospora sorghi]
MRQPVFYFIGDSIAEQAGDPGKISSVTTFLGDKDAVLEHGLLRLSMCLYNTIEKHAKNFAHGPTITGSLRSGAADHIIDHIIDSVRHNDRSRMRKQLNMTKTYFVDGLLFSENAPRRCLSFWGLPFMARSIRTFLISAARSS